MKQSYTDLKKTHFENIGQAGIYTNTTLLDNFKRNLGTRYQLIMGSISNYINQETQTATTVASQQYYYYPPATVGVDSATILIGSMRYTLSPIYHQTTWNKWNALPIQPTSIPQFIFPRKDDFGIWPIPQAAYTIEFNRFYRDRNLLVDDYSDGSISVTGGTSPSYVVTGTGTNFTSAMVGRWLTITDTSTPGEGYWYRIKAVDSTTSLQLETFWAGDTASSVSYRICECPEIPEDVHSSLSAGTTADYYAGLRDDVAKATWWNNVFWTGDGNNNSRKVTEAVGGINSLIRKYQDRERDCIVNRQQQAYGPSAKIWATVIS